jgi:class 3 adenylate cyclase/tetratricopeptide (TPR) repeat protein
VAACPACGKENPEGFQFCGFCTAPLTGDSREQRKTVTVLFCDVTGSTSLGESTDPEALRALLARYFERMRGIVESHGGTVEKFIGDAVMAVFGVPVAHEDDALRACRAAVEMREALPGLGIRGRIGVNTGEVVTGTSERLATGDAVNVAARFEQAAHPGEVLIGAATHALAREAVVVEPVEPLTLKGKAEPVPAYRLVSVLAAAEREHVSRFVGRERELGAVFEAWGRASAEQRCELVTVVGEAGVGKSRLLAEALASIDARVVRGGCPPYGEGITYWPVVEVLKQLNSFPSDPAAAASIRSLLRESDQATSAEEIAWAFRKLLEEQAPLVVLFDDVQWGEETFLDLVEGVALMSSEASLLIVCMARPEMLERRPGWPITLRLEPLSAGAVDELIGDQVAAGLRERIAAAAAGNPLFVTEMLAMGTETEDVEVPPSLRALLAARLDQLDPAERRVLERGAVEGEIFHRGAVQALAPDEAPVTPRLAALTRKQLIRPDKPQLAGEDGFRFRHLLIRDAAYEALPKSTRADLHQRFAEWLAERGSELVELDEILGYHFDQARGYAAELGRVDDSAELAGRAAGRLRVAGERAAGRGDAGAAVKLLERALRLIAPDDPARLEVRVELASALVERGELKAAQSAFTEVIDDACAAGEEVVEWRARLGLVATDLWLEEQNYGNRVESVREAIPVLERHDDDLGLARAWFLVGLLSFWDGKPGDEAFERGLACARRACSGRDEAQILNWLLISSWYGPTPASVALARCRDVLEQTPSRQVEAVARVEQGALLALSGRFDDARRSWQEGVAMLEELGLPILAAGMSEERFDIELLAGDLPAAEAVLREACDALQKLGERGFLSTRAACLGLCLVLQDRPDEAQPYLRLSMELMPADRTNLCLVHQAYAATLLSQGSLDEAEEHARQAFAEIADWGHLNFKGDALVQLADILRAAGKRQEAIATYSDAVRLYEQKQNLVAVERTRTRLSEATESS